MLEHLSPSISTAEKQQYLSSPSSEVPDVSSFFVPEREFVDVKFYKFYMKWDNNYFFAFLWIFSGIVEWEN